MRGLAIDEEKLLVGQAAELVGDDARIFVEEDDGLLDLAGGGFFRVVVLRARGRSGGEQEARGEERAPEREMPGRGRALAEMVWHDGRNIEAAKRGCQFQNAAGTTGHAGHSAAEPGESNKASGNSLAPSSIHASAA